MFTLLHFYIYLLILKFTMHTKNNVFKILLIKEILTLTTLNIKEQNAY